MLMISSLAPRIKYKILNLRLSENGRKWSMLSK